MQVRSAANPHAACDVEEAEKMVRTEDLGLTDAPVVDPTPELTREAYFRDASCRLRRSSTRRVRLRCGGVGDAAYAQNASRNALR